MKACTWKLMEKIKIYTSLHVFVPFCKAPVAKIKIAFEMLTST